MSNLRLGPEPVLMPPPWRYLLLGVLPALGFLLILLCTRWGAAVSADSVDYIDAARGLLGGRGYTTSISGSPEPVTGWPPLYSALLAAVGLSGIDPWGAARWLNALLMAASIALIGLLILRHTAGSVTAALVGMAAALVSLDMALSHAYAMAEPLFLLLFLLTPVLLASFLRNRQPAALVAAAAVAGGGLLTKHLGLSLPLAGVVLLVGLDSQPLRVRLRNSTLFLAISLAPWLAFLLRNKASGGAASPIAFGVYSVPLETLRWGLFNITRWVVPETIPSIAFKAASVATLGGMAWVVYACASGRAYGKPAVASADRRTYLLACAALVVAHFLVLGLGALFISRDIEFSRRYLLPIHAVLLVMTTCVVHDLLSASSRRGGIRRAVGTALAVALALNAMGLSAWARGMYEQGAGYASRAWRVSDTLRRVRVLPAHQRLYSNQYDLVYFLTGRTAKELPRRQDPHSRRPLADYASSMARLGREIRSGRAAVALFDRCDRAFLPPPRLVISTVGTAYALRMRDGWILSSTAVPRHARGPSEARPAIRPGTVSHGPEA